MVVDAVEMIGRCSTCTVKTQVATLFDASVAVTVTGVSRPGSRNRTASVGDRHRVGAVVGRHGGGYVTVAPVQVASASMFTLAGQRVMVGGVASTGMNLENSDVLRGSSSPWR